MLATKLDMEFFNIHLDMNDLEYVLFDVSSFSYHGLWDLRRYSGSSRLHRDWGARSTHLPPNQYACCHSSEHWLIDSCRRRSNNIQCRLGIHCRQHRTDCEKWRLIKKIFATHFQPRNFTNIYESLRNFPQFLRYRDVYLCLFPCKRLLWPVLHGKLQAFYLVNHIRRRTTRYINGFMSRIYMYLTRAISRYIASSFNWCRLIIST